MPLNKSNGSMYEWVTHCHSHLRGSCPHECGYCYVKKMRCARFYQGPLTLKEEELKANYGTGNTIFIEHMNDMFASQVPFDFINRILKHCKEYPDNTYVFQTKNPHGILWRLENDPCSFPNSIFGTTIETNRREILKPISKAPPPIERFMCIAELGRTSTTFITIEPVMKFDPEILGEWIVTAKPTFVNIGADSKHCHLPEPNADDLNRLIKIINDAGIEIRKKTNLGRLLGA